MTETPAPGQDTDDGISSFLVADKYAIFLRRPTDGQLAVLMLMAGVDPADGFRSIINNLGAVEEVMDSLCVPPGSEELEEISEAVDVRTLKRLMARGEIGLEDYFGPAIGLVEKWGDDEEVAANREARRAQAKAPAKKAVARPGRARR